MARRRGFLLRSFFQSTVAWFFESATLSPAFRQLWSNIFQPPSLGPN